MSAPGVMLRILSAANSPLAVSRTAITTFAPRPASARALSYPRPVLDPVMIATRPVWSGTSFSVQRCVMTRRYCP